MTGRHFVTTVAAFVLTLSLVVAAQTTQNEQQTSNINWQEGPTTANLGGIARVEIPPGYAFADKEGAQKVLEATQNLVSGNEVSLVQRFIHAGNFVPNAPATIERKGSSAPLLDTGQMWQSITHEVEK